MQHLLIGRNLIHQLLRHLQTARRVIPAILSELFVPSRIKVVVIVPDGLAIRRGGARIELLFYFDQFSMEQIVEFRRFLGDRRTCIQVAIDRSRCQGKKGTDLF
ncbi:hypothetical protein CD58_03760 [Pseudomonas brassicacearum]|nr:hypothetical protein [Pseudomonas brassicacearum]AHL36827.1 hypothetical protein CD58_03760 [Pseudomonas brassicacearum]